MPALASGWRRRVYAGYVPPGAVKALRAVAGALCLLGPALYTCGRDTPPFGPGLGEALCGSQEAVWITNFGGRGGVRVVEGAPELESAAILARLRAAGAFNLGRRQYDTQWVGNTRSSGAAAYLAAFAGQAAQPGWLLRFGDRTGAWHHDSGPPFVGLKGTQLAGLAATRG